MEDGSPLHKLGLVFKV